MSRLNSKYQLKPVLAEPGSAYFCKLIPNYAIATAPDNQLEVILLEVDDQAKVSQQSTLPKVLAVDAQTFQQASIMTKENTIS